MAPDGWMLFQHVAPHTIVAHEPWGGRWGQRRFRRRASKSPLSHKEGINRIGVANGTGRRDTRVSAHARVLQEPKRSGSTAA